MKILIYFFMILIKVILREITNINKNHYERKIFIKRLIYTNGNDLLGN